MAGEQAALHQTQPVLRWGIEGSRNPQNLARSPIYCADTLSLIWLLNGKLPFQLSRPAQITRICFLVTFDCSPNRFRRTGQESQLVVESDAFGVG